MFKRKDPGKKSVNTDAAEDEAIIDLTDEVDDPSDDDSLVFELAKDTTDDAAQTPGKEMRSGDEKDKEAIAHDATEPSALPDNDVNFGLDTWDIEDQDDTAQDRPVTSAIEASREAEDDINFELNDETDLNATDDDDTLIIDNSRDDDDEDIGLLNGIETDAAPGGEDLFDIEKEIELEYDLDEEQNLIDLDMYRTEEDHNFVNLMLNESKESDQDDDDEEPTEYLEFEPDIQNKIVAPVGEQADDAEDDAPAEDEELEYLAKDDLPDLDAVSELDFKDLYDAADNANIDEPATDSSDDLIASTVDSGLDSDDDAQLDDLSGDTSLEFEDDFQGLDEPPDHNQEILPLVDDETPLSLDGDEELLELDEGEDPEADDEVIPLDDLNHLDPPTGDDIIEITEFDQHFTNDSQSLLKKSGLMDASAADEDDFLELIEIEEDILSEDEEIVGSSDFPEKADRSQATLSADNELEDSGLKALASEPVLSDDLEDRLLDDEVSEPLLDDLSAKEFESDRETMDDETMKPVAQLPDPDTELAAASDNLFSESEDFDLAFDTGAIAKRVDQLDTFLPDDDIGEPIVASLPVDQTDEEKKLSSRGDSQINGDPDEPLTVPPGQIDAAVERIINEKFAGKIEDIIYEVIEKAVSKEIDRLKGALMGKDMIDDNQS